MPDPRATPLHVSPLQHDVLQQLERRSTSPQRLVRRGKIILAAATGATNTKITQDRHVDSDTVRLWRERGLAAEARLQARDRNRQAETAQAGHRSAFDR
jgi:hypothetical protein